MRGGRESTFAAHGDGIGYSNGVELPGKETFLLKASLDDMAEVKN